ncbi:helix-turn-helix transcriptional regulator [Streptomyces sp. NPDC005811]|uniref:helix-turn-helix domain-containing protein n=1 Tax=Streptomyces sp. NPDC005811 TaxID=3154565 RepID=UPI0033CB6BF2
MSVDMGVPREVVVVLDGWVPLRSPRASAGAAARDNALRPIGRGGTIPACLTCSYMGAWDDRPGRDEAGGRVSSGGDVAEFAALLTELKARTGRSYGSLARRVGMNTSTLHRYCTGEAVPQDFAPLERLAEFCGATPEERLDLHRRWLSAAAARTQRGRGAVAGGAGTGVGADAEAGAEAEADAEAGASGTGGGGAASSGGPVGSARWYRRSRTAVLVGGACAVLVSLGALSAWPDGRRATSDALVRPAVPSPSASLSSSPSVLPSPSTAPTTAPSSSPSPTPSSPSPSPSPSASVAAPVAGTPFAWTVDSQVWAQGCGHDYVIDAPPARVPPPPSEQDAETWASAQGAVHGRETNVEIAVQGHSSTAVVLTALRVRVVGRAAPAPGTVYTMDRGCGGALSRRYFAVDLDRDRPLARSVAGNDAGTPIPAVRLPYRVSAEDPEVLLVTARTTACGCAWYLELDWSSQGRTGTVRIDDHGRPFRTSAVDGLARYVYDTSARRWQPYRP